MMSMIYCIVLQKVPLHLSYRIFESSSKRIKLSEDNATYRKSLTNAGIDSEELKDDKSKREWKEVQLKISETGVMSITDISNTVHKRTTGIENLQNEKAVEETLTSIEVKKEDLIVDNCSISKSSAEIIQPSLVIDAQMTNNSTISDLNNAFLTASDVKSTIENSSIKNCVSSSTQHNGSVRQTSETENCAASTKSQGTREVKDCNVEDKPVLSGQKTINQPATQFVEKSAPQAEDKEGTDVGVKKLSINNNNNSTDFKVGNPEESVKECAKNETKVENTGSKIDALSAKLQFQPKLGQINNTYSKKAPKEKRTISQQCAKKSDVKSSTEDTKVAVKTRTNCGTSGKASVSCSTASPQKSTTSAVTSQSAAVMESSPGPGKQEALYEKNNQNSNIDVQQALNLLEQKTNSSMQALAESVSKATTSTSSKLQCTRSNNTSATNESAPAMSNISTPTVGHTTSTFSYTFHDLVTNSTTLKPTLKNSNSSCMLQKSLGMPPVISSTSNSQISSMPQFSIQTSSTGVYSTPVSLKNNYSNVNQNVSTVMTTSTATIAATAMPKPMSGTGTVPPCPDAIPISLMKQASMRKQEVTAKGTNLNEICAKIGSNTTGSKINDICAKIGENSKEKNRIETRKSDVPDLLKISTKKNSAPSSNSDTTIKHIPNIPNVPVYTPSSSATTMESKSTLSMATSVNVLAGSMPSISTSSIPTSSHMTQKTSSLRKHSQPMGYKTLRDPPKSWNPTLSKNNYVAVKNQAKEMQNSASEGTSKQIPSKPAKIFKMRNMPRYLGNPASGVKPMYGVTNDAKEKEQSSTKSATLSMMKIDPKTLSPIVSTMNSIVSPPPYSPNTRSYQTPFPRDICRNTGSPLSPRNSPVNILSTNPFIPSPTPNTNPRIIYSHFPPPFPDASRFPNPLIRSPIGIPPPSAFHSSLPPSINKLYQRSGYVPPTTGYSPVSSQPPTVQRIPPSTHSSSPKSPKASSPSSISSMSFNLGKAESQSPITSTVDSVALLLSKSVSLPSVSVSPQRELNAFNLSKTGSLTSVGSTSSIAVKTSSAADTSNIVAETQISKQSFPPMSLNSATITSTEVFEKSSSSSSTNERKQCKDTEVQKAQETTQSREENSKTKLTETRCGTDIADNTASSPDKKQKNQAAKINGDVTMEKHVSKKSAEDNVNETAKPLETTARDSQAVQERSSSREENGNPKSNVQTNINNSPASDSKNEDLGKTNEQIQGKKSEVQKSKAET